jgi:uncharacterized protein YybS (DUF2232 family)
MVVASHVYHIMILMDLFLLFPFVRVFRRGFMIFPGFVYYYFNNVLRYPFFSPGLVDFVDKCRYFLPYRSYE